MAVDVLEFLYRVGVDFVKGAARTRWEAFRRASVGVPSAVVYVIGSLDLIDALRATSGSSIII